MSEYLESKKREAAKIVEDSISTVMEICNVDRETAIRAAQRGCKQDYDRTRIQLNGVPETMIDQHIDNLRENAFMKKLILDYANTLGD